MLSPTEEIKQRLDLVEFIANYIPLKKAGANFKANCPFHHEKTASFMVSRSKQIWHCFGCNTGGDIFGFLMKMDGLEFGEAIKILAQKAGVELPRFDPQLNTLRNTLINILEAAKDFFVTSLKSPAGKIASDYLARRGLDEAIIKTFDLGYAPNDWDQLLCELSKKFRPVDIFAAGLIVKKDRGDGFYDRFRHRLMFPIKDVHGNIVGFTGRILDEGQTGGKYVNTPETAVYNKSRVLYNLDLAKQTIKEKDLAVIMEGNMDVITSFQFGFKNAVASSGTALTLDQLKLMKRYTKNIALAFDADAAGQTAAKRGIDLALKEGMSVRVIEIPEGAGKDPDDCLRQNKDLWQKALDQAKEIMEWYFAKAHKKYDLSQPAGRRGLADYLLPEIGCLESVVEQDFWLKKIAAALDMSPEILKNEMRQYQNQANQPPQPRSPAVVATPAAIKTRKKMLEERLISLMAIYPAGWPRIFGGVMPDFFSDTQDASLYTKFADYYNIHSAGLDGAPSQGFSVWLNQEDANLAVYFGLKELQGDKDFGDWDEERILGEAKIIIAGLRKEFFHEKRTDLARQMAEAERCGDREKIKEIGRLCEEIMIQETSQ